MRLLVYTKDSPTLCSAYGKIADELFLQRLAQSERHKTALFCTVGYDLGCLDAGGTLLYPKIHDNAGEDVFLQHYKDFNADLYITTTDVWIFNRVPQAAQKREIFWIPWCFVDYDPVDSLKPKLEPALKVIPTSKWLERQFRKIGLVNVSPPIFLGVNQNVYKPIVGDTDDEGNEITKERLRKTLGFDEDTFVITMCQMNQLWRKPYELQIEGCQIFQENNPDIKVRLYIHTMPRVATAWSLPEMCKMHGFDYQKYEVRFADEYTMLKGLMGYNEDHMSKIYNASDVVLNATTGESPGMPILEGQSCGTPVISTDFVCMPEFTKAGYTVKVMRYERAPNMPEVRKALPDPYDIADKLEKLLNSDPAYWRKIGHEFISQFSWECALNDWLLLFEEIEEDIDRLCLTVPKFSEGLNILSSQVNTIM